MADPLQPAADESSAGSVNASQDTAPKNLTMHSLHLAEATSSSRTRRTVGISEDGEIGDFDQQPPPATGLSSLLSCGSTRTRRPVGPLPQGQKNALLNDIEDTLGANYPNALMYLDWAAVILQTIFSAVATALAGFSASKETVVGFTASATVAGALIALFKNSGEPQLSIQRKLELDHLRLKVEAVDANIALNNGAALANLQATLINLRQEYETIDKQTSSAYVGVTATPLTMTAAQANPTPAIRSLH
ncbi:uncharacterized protein V1513DRAFT_263252 [Lipomyces chichibuensis]|uniref:uncharacterized protein n=1 Tax=Lipomyces chichibuensis TaxID=1546026 RepID=UPI003342EBF1